MPIPSRFHYISSLPAANPTGTIAHCEEVIGYFSKLGHASSLYKTEGTGMDFAQEYYSHPSAQIPLPKNNDNNVGHKESCNSDVKVETYISPKSKHPFYIHGDVPHDYWSLQNLEWPLHKSLRTSLPIRSFQNDMASSASPAFRSHDSGDGANLVSKFQSFTPPPSDLESCTDSLQGDSEGRIDTRVYQKWQLANNSIAEVNSNRKASTVGQFKTQSFSLSSSPCGPVKYDHYGSCSAVYFRQDGSENYLAQPPQALASYYSIMNAAPLGIAPTSSGTNRSDVLTVRPTDLWKESPEVLGPHWSGAILSNNLSHPSNMSVSCQESQSYNDANTSNGNISASSFYPSHASQLPFTQIAYQQHGSNHIDSRSPTPSFPSNGVQIQEEVHNMRRNKSSDIDYVRTVAIDQLCPRSFPGVCLHPQCQCKRTNKPKLYSRYKDWQGHFKRAHHKQYLCGLPGCPDSEKRYGTKAEAKRHRLSVHHFGKENAKHWDCQIPTCQRSTKVFTRSDKYKDHHDKWHGPFPCQYQGCVRGLDHGFKDQDALDKHRRKGHRRG
ncbi:putative transcription factor c2h2 protein [Botrytis fragariae]|uniref:Putative transcription factor c2h2 protein n=1 Tax=Botrytis fragariae TaxID=1964551 RepID=A0A8H6ECV2_9HELO|nr:putative transcription factor c2h2 protein [Botrytis fragariae]KAF5867691.1 putative transcription factor c2h2 protein [Botrytis fragariae]